MSKTGTLYIVATPIGNLEDVTLRALRILKEVDAVLAEDTRVTKKLLSHYQIDTKIVRFDALMETKLTDEAVRRLSARESLALVTDAGTPGVSDPGARLVKAAREVGIHIEAIPGASSLTTALSISGLSADEFLFLGFLPHKKGRQTLLKRIAEYDGTVVLFESTHRIVKLLGELAEYATERTVVLARELTKMHEEVLTGTPAELTALLTSQSVKQKGEFVVIVAHTPIET
ncbi:16S rRNA (cytidine(1402)-2'-O)-methyltransferase [Candidatus Kaiserbacteria bacterium]|nr:16S rRNA (cytidine(1402)-2'-O)-methyltransferase [Candidatus Kaiserbacteria bacterium]